MGATGHGAVVEAWMSVFPNWAGQAVAGSGTVSGLLVYSDWR